MKSIQKIKLFNFKRFREFEVEFTEDLNVLIGDNEAGKSTLLTAIELVISGSRNKVDVIGLESIFNKNITNQFLAGDKSVANLPVVIVELYLSEQHNPDIHGKNNSDGTASDGLRLTCEPNEDLLAEMQQVLAQDSDNFPYEYYSVKFTTFAGESYTGYRKFIKHLSLDSSQINSEYATREYIKTVYESVLEHPERINLRNLYRQQKSDFKDEHLKGINDQLNDYQFAIRSNSRANLETDVIITEDDVPLENRGKGRQCFIKTEFALKRYGVELDIDTLLLEEPENHLSHTNMKKLVTRIAESQAKQIFIATHSNLITSRLDLRKSILLNSTSQRPVLLKDLPADTAKFFMKAPDNNILEFILSSKVILVEGDAEYILIDAIYSIVTGSSLEADDVHVISVGGTSFKRYLDLAMLLNIKTAVIRDNDGDAQVNCTENYADYTADNIKIFFDTNNSNSTFEICFYELNTAVCEELFAPGRRTLSVQDYMLKNKADCAYELLDKKSEQIQSPEYITEALQWIRE